MRETVNILGVNIDKITAADALDRAEEMVKTPGVSAIYTPNPEIVMAAYEDKAFLKILNEADMCTPDGIGVVYGSRIIGNPVPERVAGFDLACGLLDRIRKTGESVFLFGSKPGVAELAGENLKEKYPDLVIAGTHDGYFKEEDVPEIIEQINNSGASLLFVCLGAPKQEKWIAANRDQLKVNLCMGIGGALDVFAGTVKRAPDIFIKLNLEWFYRMCKQPSRFIRCLALPKFILTVKKESR
ncbi:MAG: WecB/TagA/CpsF family glycosyltransferase [Clostridia bacterium]|nr:WecB/TagA/CpsF family glycosyltransferase [Clostridia bacterium]